MATKWTKKHKDPHFKREKGKYEHPIPSREYILAWLDKKNGPVTFKQIMEELCLLEEEELEALRWRLSAMIRDGQLFRNRKGGYGSVNKTDLVRGVVLGHPDGFGFLVPDDGDEDVFLSTRQMHRVFHSDRALVRVASFGPKKKKEGSIVEVLERNVRSVVGRFHVEDGLSFLIPDNKRITQHIFIPQEACLNAKNGQIVVAEITKQPTKHNQPVGKIIEILGEHLQPGMEIDVAIRSHDLSFAWPKEVKKVVKNLPKDVSEKEIKAVKDLRHLPFVTIDGEDAKDFDDAIYCHKEARGWRLWVAIAHVSHYVKPHSELDKEAYERGNSVYFPEKVIPMLPEALSNELCSLKPNVDRLCLVCEMRFNDEGRMTRSRFYEAVIHSHARLTYTQVGALIEGEKNDIDASLSPFILNIYSLYEKLHEIRIKRGALDFDTTETKILFDNDKKIKEIVEVHRNKAHRLVEECMLSANVAAAKFLEKSEIPALFRVHAGPDADKLDNLRRFVSELGLKLSGGKKPKAKTFSQLLEQAVERPDAHLIQTLLLRTMNQAVYSPRNIGHFGLAYNAYTHFTSPIRRYPDLLVHRAIVHLVNKQPIEQFIYDISRMERFGAHCSMTERRADDAVRDAIYALKCEYMQDKIGELYSGTISGVVGFGFFVELDDLYVDGLVHISTLANDYYHFDAMRQRLKGERTGKDYHLGDRVRVVLAAVDMDDKKIDFELFDE